MNYKKFLISLKLERKRMGYSQKYMAQKLGNKTDVYYHNLESGKRKISLEVYWKLLEILEISPYFNIKNSDSNFALMGD